MKDRAVEEQKLETAKLKTVMDRHKSLIPSIKVKKNIRSFFK